MRFAKYEGLGNDFIVVDANSATTLSAARVAALCDRRFGIGADGVLLVTSSEATTGDSAIANMKVLNADGSNPEMCGNGLRCVALHLASKMSASAAKFVISTDAGLRTCNVDRNGNDAIVSVDMGEVRALGSRTIVALGMNYEVFVGDAGNPHAIMFGRFTRQDAERIGPAIEKDATFPKGTNVEFATVHDARIDLIVWERGVGITLACGTGACATAVVARHLKLVPAEGEIIVSLLGGELRVQPEPQGRTTMTGPARLVFVGDVP